MSKPIELQRGRYYKVIEGGRSGQVGICVNIRLGMFGRSWGELIFPDDEREYVRSHYLEEADALKAPAQ